MKVRNILRILKQLANLHYYPEKQELVKQFS